MFDLDGVDDGEDFHLLDAQLDAILDEFFMAGVTSGIIEIDGVEMEYQLVIDLDRAYVILGMDFEVSSDMSIYGFTRDPSLAVLRRFTRTFAARA